MLLVPSSISRRVLLLVFLAIAMIIFFSSINHEPSQSPFNSPLEEVNHLPIAPVDVSVGDHSGAGSKQIVSVDEPIADNGGKGSADSVLGEEQKMDVENDSQLAFPTASTLLQISSTTSTSTTNRNLATSTPFSRPPHSHSPHLYPPPNKPLPRLNPLVIPPVSSSPPPATPLFIGYTRNYPILQQCILAYLTSGWPAGQIYIVDNTGTMNSNKRNLLSSENPFYLPYKHLTEVFGVNIITTPALLTFSQLQNFYISTALEKGWSRFFWSHMDAVPLSYEDQNPFISVYSGILELLTQIDYRSPQDPGNEEKWALKFFSYDRLALVNVEAVVAVGAWDTLIPFYYSDCDFYSRVRMHGYTIQDHDIGYIFDVADTLDDLSFFFPGGLNGKFLEVSPDTPISASRWWALKETLVRLEEKKNTHKYGRNYWQARQRGGAGDPFYRDMTVFETEIQKLIKLGQGVYRRKWAVGPGICDLDGEGGKHLRDMWKEQLFLDNVDIFLGLGDDDDDDDDEEE